LRRGRYADEDDVVVVQAASQTVVEPDRELDRLHALEVRRVEWRSRPGRHLRRHARDARDGVDRLAEQVAVVELRAAAERPHGVAKLRLHERVDDDRRTTLHPIDGEVEVPLRLDTRVADLDELLVRELRLE